MVLRVIVVSWHRCVVMLRRSIVGQGFEGGLLPLRIHSTNAGF